MATSPNTPHLLATGLAVGHTSLTNFEFDKDKPYRACLICGRVFQSSLDRALRDNFSYAATLAAKLRDEWAESHSRTHSLKEHHLLQISGASMTPEAAARLQTYGLIPVTDMVVQPEVADALRSTTSTPQDNPDTL
jgi:hypothetical protein